MLLATRSQSKDGHDREDDHSHDLAILLDRDVKGAGLDKDGSIVATLSTLAARRSWLRRRGRQVSSHRVGLWLPTHQGTGTGSSAEGTLRLEKPVAQRVEGQKTRHSASVARIWSLPML